MSLRTVHDLALSALALSSLHCFLSLRALNMLFLPHALELLCLEASSLIRRTVLCCFFNVDVRCT